ncbi:hypothetical protein HPB48_017871 [Haemaphysalis longicornis]|uniref:MULE transposase domain-containing protein n=1 Tax=Haemaphysalis longicornis TaxID=44386 RepID=A0A9J6GMZ5_HAELO|nr:hypothetical protein HPB48_017871 [Haemaphysalis longicornis]
MKMLPALAFLPVGATPEAFYDMLEVFPQEAIKLAGYFEDVYVGRPRRNGICSAQFPPKLWSVYESALDGMPRTNNSVEAWHYGLQSNVRRASPNLWVFLHCLKKEKALSEMKLSQAAAGSLLQECRGSSKPTTRAFKEFFNASMEQTTRLS